MDANLNLILIFCNLVPFFIFVFNARIIKNSFSLSYGMLGMLHHKLRELNIHFTDKYVDRPAKTKEIPENPTSKHPVQLLNEMNGPIEFELTGEAGEMPQAKVGLLKKLIIISNQSKTKSNINLSGRSIHLKFDLFSLFDVDLICLV